MKKLETYDDVVNAFGGSTELAKLLGRGAPSIWNWQHKRGRFPAQFYRAMTEALAENKMTAAPELWGQVKLARRSPSMQRAA